jgi:hypothetical protein
MGKFSFELKDHHDYLAKLNAEHADLQQEPLSSRHAINFAMTAYHMCEWIWEHETLVNSNPAYTSAKSFYDAVNRACPIIPIMRDLTNGSKHTKITRGPAPIVDGAVLQEGTFDDTFDSTFDTTALLVNMVDGTVRDFVDDATAAVDFWRRVFQSSFRL